MHRQRVDAVSLQSFGPMRPSPALRTAIPFAPVLRAAAQNAKGPGPSSRPRGVPPGSEEGASFGPASGSLNFRPQLGGLLRGRRLPRPGGARRGGSGSGEAWSSSFPSRRRRCSQQRQRRASPAYSFATAPSGPRPRHEEDPRPQRLRPAMGSRLSRPQGGRTAGGLGVPPPASAPSPAPRRPDLALLPAVLRGQRGKKRPWAAPTAPYARRVAWIRDIQARLRQRRREEALQLLRLLRKDLGLEGTFLSEVLYKNAAFLNLVDPISHSLLMSLARDLQCPPKEYDPWKSSDRICRQLIYHLTPHSKWHRHGGPRRKLPASLKNSLQKKLSQDAINLSGISLSSRDVHRLAYYLQSNGARLHTVDLSFTDVTDEAVRLLLPFLWRLPNLTHLSLNGNRLTRATVRELTDAVKDMRKFPLLAWIDLGNNVDIASMPQPLLVGLRKRLSLRNSLPTIYEALDCDSESSSPPEEGEQGGPLAADAAWKPLAR